ncbi:S9 family peptidase [Paraglaciecola sp. MB-3u-78]|uniref:alpha/beta hydrolase family protein n=1 Tax=Paraglaciecola sp. MB-3u-78 TaxID=2058332 RepID=UPI000C329B31|nr:prolyl oligopeptidase family serine peptidase [Paraglaciecola sp. MB-3u-78]PKH00854.1 hypothetical protein CXF95_01125 [Paraglaciecola sp. MB-3u-78]
MTDSYAGVTDLTLMFNKGTLKSNLRLSEELKKIVGDPSTQLDELMKNSPVYPYKKIKKTVLLLHGFSDDVVDIEHSFRLQLMMETQDNKVDFVKFNGLEHSFKTIKEVEAVYKAIMPFYSAI